MKYKIIAAIATVGLLAAVAAAPAGALTRDKARALAKHDQAYNCFHYDSAFWVCRDAYWISPGCQLSSLPSGRGQWLCVGKFLQVFHQPIFGPAPPQTSPQAPPQAQTSDLVHRLCTNRLRYTVYGRRIVNNISCEIVTLG